MKKQVLEYSSVPSNERNAIGRVLIGTLINAVLLCLELSLRPSHGIDVVEEAVPMMLQAATIPIAALQVMAVFREVSRCGSLRGSTLAALLLTAVNLVAITAVALVPWTVH